MVDYYCPKYQKCPIFNNKLLKRKQSEEVYKNLYCKMPGKGGWERCKRYLVAEKMGRVPDWVMPNSTYSVEEIIERMNNEGE